MLACFLGLLGSSARADLNQWATEVNAGGPPNFLGTNITPIPGTVDLGAMSGDITYEFVVNANRVGASSALLGSFTGGQAIKFNQWNNTGYYGLTAYGVADYDFGVPTTFGSDVVLAFVADSAAGTTSLFVNGADTGASVPLALNLNGLVGVGGAVRANGTFIDPLDGQMLGLAVFNRKLTGDEIRSHADAYSADVIPEPGTLALLLGALPMGSLALRRRRSGAPPH